ncbi:hypothetical protein BJ085DRAFT_38726 [Dimargaris cristalligena]|uniref:Methyltransferase-domain-containing protein n=1 Tax=Dimargaris cristalligena TaxID=215637 RepID=A0A4P9ZNG7_9FUNG|nr:hypothetical protein BJ085DRAFT_38726 [Dimargaris cristalligena]|eukprot:RKP33850.1 hypothetical protein BJ085DRAFT_38726 [Dimargaris cristalligena]
MDPAQILVNCQHNVSLNQPLLSEAVDPPYALVGLDWGKYDPALARLASRPVDLIIGADCFYNSQDFEDLLSVVAFLLDAHPRAYFLTMYQERSASRNIHNLLLRWQLKGVLVPFGAEVPSSEGSSENTRVARCPGLSETDEIVRWNATYDSAGAGFEILRIERL